MENLWKTLGFYPADIMLPRTTDMTKWAVVACDQFTSQPEYWQEVESYVADAPSAFRLILPEAKLKEFVGHTPVQVLAGVIIGIGNAFLMHALMVTGL